tara:strand:+ start:752 stop:1582 length:831 start_codon:yes stop_codon:yes gene_type:complete
MIKKFVIRKSKKFKFTKLPSQPTDRLQSLDKFRYDAKKKAIFTRRPDIGSMFKQEAAAKFARGVEASKLESGLKKVRKAAIKQFKGTQFYTKKPGIVIRKDLTPKPGKNILSNDLTNFNIKKTRLSTSGDPFVFAKKTPEGKQALARINKAKTQAVKTARAAGIRALQKRSTEFGVGIKKYGSQKSKFVQKLSDEEARELGFPPREVFKSSKKTPMTDIDKSVSEYTTVEKLNPQTKKFETFRKFKLGSSGKAGTGFIDRRFVFYDKKLKGYRKKK